MRPEGPNVQELPVSKATHKMQLALIGGASRVCPVSIPESSLVILGRDGTGANKVRNSTLPFSAELTGQSRAGSVRYSAQRGAHLEESRTGPAIEERDQYRVSHCPGDGREPDPCGKTARARESRHCPVQGPAGRAAPWRRDRARLLPFSGTAVAAR